MGKTIGIIGSRRRANAADFLKLKIEFEKRWEPGDRVVSGGCPIGGDKFAEVLAEKVGAEIVVHRANWTRDGKAAGFVRNTQIAKDADLMLALVAEDRTGGTEDTLRKFKKLKPEGEIVEL